jgi:hypothetical protein
MIWDYAVMLPLLQKTFPALTTVNSRLTSPVDGDYNCIAWAAECNDAWWWPDVQGTGYWPHGVPREETITAFASLYGLHGFLEVSDSKLEVGKQKVAIYALAGKPTHAARQLQDGWWASKLGPSVDIEHDLQALDGKLYGRAELILARTLTGS